MQYSDINQIVIQTHYRYFESRKDKYIFIRMLLPTIGYVTLDWALILFHKSFNIGSTINRMVSRLTNMFVE